MCVFLLVPVTTLSPFLFLAFELPPPPLFQEDLETSIIPQVPLVTLLSKYDGLTWKVTVFGFVTIRKNQLKLMWQEYGTTTKRMKITKLPKYLVFHFKRFSKNNFTKEKNPTIVSFPLKGVDMSECENIYFFDNNLKFTIKFRHGRSQ
jgi:U4/U6.U5 tri-snRNP-associated protein 2